MPRYYSGNTRGSAFVAHEADVADDESAQGSDASGSLLALRNLDDVAILPADCLQGMIPAPRRNYPRGESIKDYIFARYWTL
jgi:hypothetical protein